MDNKASSQQQNDGFEETKNYRNMIYYDAMLQDPNVTPMELPLFFVKGITNDFSEENVLGHGGFGVVYKGVLKNGKMIAVKRLRNLEANLDGEQYQKELKNLFGLQNKNVVQFKGYCDHTFEVPWPESQSQGRDQCTPVFKIERLLCFEYISNGTLREHIQDASCGLEWLITYEIINDICSGLHYLHTERGIAHMDLKPENILLDDNMVPKIADFGTARLFHENESRIITKTCLGSRGYLAPEYVSNGIISKKADIFSLGVIILELLTGSKHEYPRRKELFLQFSDGVVKKWRNRLPNEDYSEQVRKCVSIALGSMDANPYKRHTIGCIIKKLDELQNPWRSWSKMLKCLKIWGRGSRASESEKTFCHGCSSTLPIEELPKLQQVVLGVILVSAFVLLGLGAYLFKCLLEMHDIL